jgi:hypothetical protein
MLYAESKASSSLDKETLEAVKITVLQDSYSCLLERSDIEFSTGKDGERVMLGQGSYGQVRRDD